jgi:hypothetical protein
MTKSALPYGPLPHVHYNLPIEREIIEVLLEGLFDAIDDPANIRLERIEWIDGAPVAKLIVSETFYEGVADGSIPFLSVGRDD